MTKKIVLFRIFFFSIIIACLILFNSAHSKEIKIESLDELILSLDQESKTLLIDDIILIDKNIIIPKNISLRISNSGSFYLKKYFEMHIKGEILGVKKKIFYFEDELNGYKNLKIDNTFFDVRWFGNPSELISQKFSSYHDKTMYFDNYTIKSALDFRISNIKAHFNNTIIEKTFHFSDTFNENEKFIENIKITGNLYIQERLGGLKGKNIFIDSVHILSSEKQMPAGVHIYDSIENLNINYLYIEDSIRNYAFGIDSSTLEKMPKNINIKEIEIKNSFVHGALINGNNINIGKIRIDSFGDMRKSNFTNKLTKGFNIPFDFEYLDLFEYSPKGLVIAYGSNINIGELIVKTKNYSFKNFFDYFKIKKFFMWPSIYFVDLTKNARINKITLEIPKSVKIVNKILNFSNNLLFKILDMGDENFYKVNYDYINLRPFKISN